MDLPELVEVEVPSKKGALQGISLKAQLVGKKRQFTSITVAAIHEKKCDFADKVRKGDRIVYVGQTILADNATLEEVLSMFEESSYPLLVGFEKSRRSSHSKSKSALSNGKRLKKDGLVKSKSAPLPTSTKPPPEPPKALVRRKSPCWDQVLEKYVYPPKTFSKEWEWSKRILERGSLNRYESGGKIWYRSSRFAWEVCRVISADSESLYIELPVSQNREAALVEKVAIKDTLPFRNCHTREHTGKGDLINFDSFNIAVLLYRLERLHKKRRPGFIRVGSNIALGLNMRNHDAVDPDTHNQHIFFSILRRSYDNALLKRSPQAVVITGASRRHGETGTVKMALEYLLALSNSPQAAAYESKKAREAAVVASIADIRTETSQGVESLASLTIAAFDLLSQLLSTTAGMHSLHSSVECKMNVHPKNGINGVKFGLHCVDLGCFDDRKQGLFEIFYQLCSRSVRLRFEKELGCDVGSVHDYKLLRHGAFSLSFSRKAKGSTFAEASHKANSEPRVHGSFKTTDSALQLFGYTAKERDRLWRALLAILHLGNLRFKRRKNSGVYLKDPRALRMAALLLAMDTAELQTFLCSFKSTRLAKARRNQLMKRIYLSILQNVCKVVNKKLCQGSAKSTNVLRVFHSTVMDSRLCAGKRSRHDFIRHLTQLKIVCALARQNALKKSGMKEALRSRKRLVLKRTAYDELLSDSEMSLLEKLCFLTPSRGANLQRNQADFLEKVTGFASESSGGSLRVLVKDKAFEMKNNLVDSQDRYYVDALLSTYVPDADTPKEGLRLLRGNAGESATDFGEYVTYLNTLLLDSEFVWLACVQSSSSALIDDDSMPVQETLERQLESLGMSVLLSKLDVGDRVIRRSWHFVSSRLFVYGVVSLESWKALAGCKSEHKERCKRVLLDFFGKRSAGQAWLMVKPAVFLHNGSFERITRAVYMIQEAAVRRIQRFIEPLRRRLQAARRIQRLARDIILKPQVEHRAATLIASTYVGFAVRRDFKKIVDNAVTLQSAWRSFAIRTSSVNPANRAYGVVALQRVFRGYLVRKLLKVVHLSRMNHLNVLWDNECVLMTSLVRVSGIVHRRGAKVQAILTTKRRLIFVELTTMRTLNIVSAEGAVTTNGGKEVDVGDVRFEDILVEGAVRWVDMIEKDMSVAALFEKPLVNTYTVLQQAVLLSAHVGRRSDRMSFLWRQGWVMCHNSTLFWFSKESTIPKNSFGLPSASVVDVTGTPDIRKPNVLKVDDGNGSSMLVSFATHKEKAEWMRLVRLTSTAVSSQRSSSPRKTATSFKSKRLGYYFPRLRLMKSSRKRALAKSDEAGLYWTFQSSDYADQHRLFEQDSGYEKRRRKEIVAERAAQSQWRVVKKAFGGVTETGEEEKQVVPPEDVERKSESDSGESDYSEAESEHGQEKSSKKEAGTLDAALTTILTSLKLRHKSNVFVLNRVFTLEEARELFEEDLGDFGISEERERKLLVASIQAYCEETKETGIDVIRKMLVNIGLEEHFMSFTQKLEYPSVHQLAEAKPEDLEFVPSSLNRSLIIEAAQHYSKVMKRIAEPRRSKKRKKSRKLVFAEETKWTCGACQHENTSSFDSCSECFHVNTPDEKKTIVQCKSCSKWYRQDRKKCPKCKAKGGGKFATQAASYPLRNRIKEFDKAESDAQFEEDAVEESSDSEVSTDGSNPAITVSVGKIVKYTGDAYGELKRGALGFVTKVDMATSTCTAKFEKHLESKSGDEQLETIEQVVDFDEIELVSDEDE